MKLSRIPINLRTRITESRKAWARSVTPVRVDCTETQKKRFTVLKFSLVLWYCQFFPWVCGKNVLLKCNFNVGEGLWTQRKHNSQLHILREQTALSYSNEKERNPLKTQTFISTNGNEPKASTGKICSRYWQSTHFFLSTSPHIYLSIIGRDRQSVIR